MATKKANRPKGDKHEAMDISFALFNITDPVFQRAKNGFIRRFGMESWDKSGIQKLWDDGIMAIFQEDPTPEREWFVETVAFIVNEDYCTKK